MLDLKKVLLLFLHVSLWATTADHILFNRIVVTPTKGEMVEIINPTNEAVDLSDYYLTDAVKQSAGKYYYNLPSGTDFWSNSVSDFIARFPSGLNIQGGDTLIISMHTDSLFNEQYGFQPDLSLFEDMENAIEGEGTISYGDNFNEWDLLGNSAEVLILFYWDGISSMVQDVDYFLWGNTTHAVDKTGIQSYQNDTPIENQVFLQSHDDGFSYSRIDTDETDEMSSGGNGLTGHDETSENLGTSWLVSLYPEPEDLSIADLLDNLSEYVGQTVEIDGVVTVPAGKLRTSFTEAFLQDESGKGIILYQSSLDTSFHRGDSVMVTAEVDEFDGKPELIYSNIEILKENVDIPTVELSIEEFNTLEYNYTYVNIWGKITERSDPSGSNAGANITIQDETGEQSIVRIWNSTGVLFNDEFVLVNLTLDSLLQIGTLIEVSGIGGSYSGTSQIQPAYASDIIEKLEGTPGDFEIYLRVEPYPFVPQLGEKINYEYSFPDDARIKLRVFDISGRHITTLYDEYRGISFYKQSSWDGRDELNRVVPPGVYLMHLEITDTKTGKLNIDTAPVVIGVVGR